MRLLAPGCLLLGLATPWPAAAQAGSEGQVAPLRRAALLTTNRIKLGPQAESDAAFDREVFASLKRLQLVEVVARPALDLEAIQLSLDCVGETPSCLKAVARQTQTEILLAPAIERSDGEIVLSILYFDARGAGELRRVARHQQGDALSTGMLAQVPGMLRELLHAPDLDANPAAGPGQAGSGDEDWSDRGEDVEVSLGPLVLALVGVSALGGAVGLGLMAQETQDEYDELPVMNAKQAEAARDRLDQGELQALGANLLFTVGGVALLGAGVWLAVDLSSGRERAGELALLPELSPGRAGLALRGTWGQVVPPHGSTGRNLPTPGRRTIRALE